jgi:hypothetical protein
LTHSTSIGIRGIEPGVCGYYVLLAMVLNTAQVPLPDGAEPFQP